MLFFKGCHRFAHFFGILTLSAAKVRVGYHRDTGLYIESLYCLGGEFGNFYQLIYGRIEVHGCIGEKQRASGCQQDIHSRYTINAFFLANYLQGRTNRVWVVAGETRDKGISFTVFDHHCPKVVAVVHRPPRLGWRHALALPLFVVNLRVAIDGYFILGGTRVNDFDLANIQVVLLHQPANGFQVSQQDWCCNALVAHLLGGFEYLHVFSVGKNHPFGASLGFVENHARQPLVAA